MICSEWHKSLASRVWSPKNEIRFTKAVNATARGSNSRSPSLRNLLSAATRCLKETGSTSNPYSSAISVRMGFYLRAESAPASQKNSWQASTHNCRRSDVPPAHSSTCRRNQKADGGLGLPRWSCNAASGLNTVLIAQVKFAEWTLDDQLRQPVFLGLRTDKEAKDVVRE